MKWISDIESNLKGKKKSFWFGVFKVFVYGIIILFVLHLFVKNSVDVTNKEATANIYDC